MKNSFNLSDTLRLFILLTGSIFFMIRCARPGSPEGGDKDTVPPQVIEEKPPSGTTNFKGDKIVIKFNEFIVLDNPMQKITFSPPLEKPPTISPVGYADKKIEIKFRSPLRSGVTYTIRFNDAVKDYHEGNVMPNYTYVFSTGPRLDSLSLRGTVDAALDFEIPDNTVVALYPDSLHADSLLRYGKPYYFTYAAKDGTFVLEHLKAGSYRLYAFTDKNGSLNYQAGEESVAFLPESAKIPRDREVHLVLFTEKTPPKIHNITGKTLHHWIADFAGSPENVRISAGNRTILSYREKNRMHIWLKPVKTSDLLFFVFTRNGDTIYAAKRPAKGLQADTLLLKQGESPVYPADTLRILTTVPLTDLEPNRISATPNINIKPLILPQGIAGIVLPSPPDTLTQVEITLLPGAVKDFLGHTHDDTLRFTYRRISPRKTGELVLTADSLPPYPLKVMIISTKEKKIIRSAVWNPGKHSVMFKYLKPGKYRLLFLYDENGNGEWDTGDISRGIRPEKTYKYPKIIEIRPLWHLEEKISLPVD